MPLALSTVCLGVGFSGRTNDVDDSRESSTIDTPKRITTKQRVDGEFEYSDVPGTLMAVGKVTYVSPCSRTENVLMNSGLLLPEDQRVSRGPTLHLIWDE